MTEWKPTCSVEMLQKRASVLKDIRSFFYLREVMEVETPLLSSAIGTDPGLDFFSTRLLLTPEDKILYLQTSPEFAMKRLLAAGSGSIYQICKAFRNGESGKYHNPEFTILEWYRVDFDMYQLMDEVLALLLFLFRSEKSNVKVEKLSFCDAFFRYAGIDPIEAEIHDFLKCSQKFNLIDAQKICGSDKSIWLDFLFSHLVQPELGQELISFIYHFPSSQSSLARKHPDHPKLAERFEVFINGVELANGFHELTDADEQLYRFKRESKLRKSIGLQEPQIDHRLIAALHSGLPNCAGVAVGIDRLLMILNGINSIDQVISFSVNAA